MSAIRQIDWLKVIAAHVVGIAITLTWEDQNRWKMVVFVFSASMLLCTAIDVMRYIYQVHNALHPTPD